MYDDILFPTDDSVSTEATTEHAREIASGRDATVHILYVIDDRSFLTLDEEMQAEVLDELRADGRAATDAVAAELAGEGIEVTTALARGDPADEILAYADEAGIDLITMGTRGGDYSENMLGSTAQAVVSGASVPVLTVPLDEA
ncbi:MAG: universal stress protein [Haloarculaceae archaeon]